MNDNSLFDYECGSSKIFVEAQGGNDGYAKMITNAINYRTDEDLRPALILEKKPIYELSDSISLLQMLSGQR